MAGLFCRPLQVMQDVAVDMPRAALQGVPAHIHQGLKSPVEGMALYGAQSLLRGVEVIVGDQTTGHRQACTELKIIEIIHEGASYQKQPEKPQQSQKPAAAATAPPVKKADAAKQQAAAKKKPEKQAPAPRQPEKPKPAEQRVAPETAPIPPASAHEGTPKAEPFVPAAPSREPEKPLPPARRTEEAKPLPISREEKPSADKRQPWWIIGAIIAALALLGLLLFLGSDRPSPGPGTRQETGGKPTPEKKLKAKPPVRDVKMKETAPVDQPATPAQPPD